MWVEMTCKVVHDGVCAEAAAADLSSLKERGVGVVGKNDHIRVVPAEGEDNPCVSVPEHELSEMVQRVAGGKAYLRIMEWECGGGLPRSGDAQCVAGLQGESLRPLFVRRGRDLVNKEHALFSSQEGLIVAHAKRYKDNQQRQMTVLVSRHTFKGSRGLVETEELANYHMPDVLRGGPEDIDELEDFDEEMDWLFPVMAAAMRKVWVCHCQEALYYLSDGGRSRKVRS